MFFKIILIMLLSYLVSFLILTIYTNRIFNFKKLKMKDKSNKELQVTKKKGKIKNEKI